MIIFYIYLTYHNKYNIILYLRSNPLKHKSVVHVFWRHSIKQSVRSPNQSRLILSASNSPWAWIPLASNEPNNNEWHHYGEYDGSGDQCLDTGFTTRTCVRWYHAGVGVRYGICEQIDLLFSLFTQTISWLNAFIRYLMVLRRGFNSAITTCIMKIPLKLKNW